MRRIVIVSTLAATSLALTGCMASTVVDIATAPVRVAGKAVDLATTSQSEADEKRGREIRKREERLGQLDRRHAKEMERCGMGQEAACEAARATSAEMAALRPAIPADL